MEEKDFLIFMRFQEQISQISFSPCNWHLIPILEILGPLLH